MGAAELSLRASDASDEGRVARAVAHAAALVVGLTAVGVIIGLLAPSLGGSTDPHPSLTGSTGDALSILANNLRVLAVPFLLWVLRFQASRPGRLIGDLATLAVAALSSVTIGIALGAWGSRLIPYIPNLPAEWAALIVAVASWLLVKDQPVTARQMLALAFTVTALLCAAAALETWATPHRHSTRGAAHHAQPPALSRAGRLIGPPDCAGAPPRRAGACPSPTAVKALMRRRSTATSTTDPQGGITVS